MEVSVHDGAGVKGSARLYCLPCHYCRPAAGWRVAG
jgi:hypothetical protein